MDLHGGVEAGTKVAGIGRPRRVEPRAVKRLVDVAANIEDAASVREGQSLRGSGRTQAGEHAGGPEGRAACDVHSDATERAPTTLR